MEGAAAVLFGFIIIYLRNKEAFMQPSFTFNTP